MREIKFRAWDTKCKKMYEVLDIYWMGGEIEDIVVFNPVDGEKNKELTPSEYDLMQYTGLKDKNGKEIYESDLVIWDGGQYEVLFSELEGTWILKDDREDWECPSLYGVSSPKQSRIEVVGNKYEQHTNL